MTLRETFEAIKAPDYGALRRSVVDQIVDDIFSRETKQLTIDINRRLYTFNNIRFIDNDDIDDVMSRIMDCDLDKEIHVMEYCNGSLLLTDEYYVRFTSVDETCA